MQAALAALGMGNMPGGAAGGGQPAQRVLPAAEAERQIFRAAAELVTKEATSVPPEEDFEMKPSSGEWEHQTMADVFLVKMSPTGPARYSYLEDVHAVLLSADEQHLGHSHARLVMSAHPLGNDTDFLVTCHERARKCPPPPSSDLQTVVDGLRLDIVREWVSVAAKMESGGGRRGHEAGRILAEKMQDDTEFFQDVIRLTDPNARYVFVEFFNVLGARLADDAQTVDVASPDMPLMRRVVEVLGEKGKPPAPLIEALAMVLRAEADSARQHQWAGRQHMINGFWRGPLMMPSADKAGLYISKSTPKYPHDMRETSHTMTHLWKPYCMKHEAMKEIFKSLVKSRRQEDTLHWLTAVFTSNKGRVDTSKSNNLRDLCDDVTMMNATAVVLLLLKPVLDKPAEKRNIDPSYFHHGPLLNYPEEKRLGAWDPPPPQDPPKKFNFSTEIFCIALHALHVAVVPTAKRSKGHHKRFVQFYDHVRNQGGEDPMQEQMLIRAASAWDGVRLLLEEPTIQDGLNTLCSVACELLMSMCGPERDETQLYCVPSLVIDGIVEWFNFLSVFMPAALQSLGSNTRHVVDFIIFAMHSPTLLRKDARLQAKMAVLLHGLKPRAMQPRELNFGNVWSSQSWTSGDHRLFHLVEESKVAQEKLPAALMQVYVGVGMIEGLDVDTDDQALEEARPATRDLLRHIFLVSTFRPALQQLLETESVVLVQFVKALTLDGIHCLDDALVRLVEVLDLEQSMKNKAQWDAQPEERKQERKRHFQHQQRASRGFMRSAVETLEALQLFMKPYPNEEYLSPAFSLPAILDPLVHMLVTFLETLNGEKCERLLSLEQPQTYGYDPLGLLQMIATFAVHLSQSQHFIPVVLKNEDCTPAILEWALERIRRTNIGGLQLQEKFSSFVQAVVENQAPVVETLKLGDATQHAFDHLDEYTVIPNDAYIRAMEDLQVDSCDMSCDGTYNGHYFHQLILQNEGQLNPAKRRKLHKENKFFREAGQLPLGPQASIFVRTDESRMDVLRGIVTGPEDTPYAFGLFIIDIYCPPQYPDYPPMANLMTTGGGRVRFNPNLYESGKICLSLLGTWHGDGELSKWHADRSTNYQVLHSIQAMILVEEPYFNEPGNEAQQGTDDGRRYSQEYNEKIQISTMKYAMTEYLMSPPPGMEDLTRRHFHAMKGRILRKCKEWLDRVSEGQREKMIRAVEHLVVQLNALGDEPPVGGAAAGGD